MHVDPLEKKWMYVIGLITVVMVGSMTYAAVHDEHAPAQQRRDHRPKDAAPVR